MWNLRCKILNEDELLGLKYTKIDNEIRALYKAKDAFLPVDRSLFVLPLARILAQNPKTLRPKKPTSWDFRPPNFDSRHSKIRKT
jgi:hypothetical protein